jgi:hypothetical protein
MNGRSRVYENEVSVQVLPEKEFPQRYQVSEGAD